LKTAIDVALNQTLQMPNAGFQPVLSAKVVKVMPQRAKGLTEMCDYLACLGQKPRKRNY
jgi:hypothetical protein